MPRTTSTPLAHVASLALPIAASVIVPGVMLARSGWPPVTLGRAVVGGAVIAVGLALLAWTVGLFARVGRGTLAPWDPTRKLVVVGPYAHVRNPMITGVLFVLVGEAILFASNAIATWAALFVVVNHVYFVLSEEPGLLARFGDEYAEYRRNVPRWIPRVRRWPSSISSSRAR